MASSVNAKNTHVYEKYVLNLPKNIRQQAEYIKPLYIKNRIADNEISSENNHNKFESEYKEAINTLYEGNIKDSDSLQQILNLVSYSPSLFTDKDMLDLLMQQSKPLANFLINYQVMNVLIKPENNINPDEKLKDIIIAEQSGALDNLTFRLESTKLKNLDLTEQIAILSKEKNELSQKLQSTQKDTKIKSDTQENME